MSTIPVFSTYKIEQQGNLTATPLSPPRLVPTTADFLSALEWASSPVITEVEILRVANAKLREQVARLENDLAAAAAPAPPAPAPTAKQQRDTAVGAAIFRTRRQDQLRQPQPCHDGI